MSKLRNRSYFFDKGLRFECQQCGKCCTGEPGTIYVSETEMRSMSEFLRISLENLKEKYLYPFKDSYSIKEDADGRCFFYQEGCGVYPVRPGQCDSYPFWFTNIRAEEKWKSVAKECCGIGKGQLYSKEKILEINESTFPWIMKSVFGASEKK